MSTKCQRLGGFGLSVPVRILPIAEGCHLWYPPNVTNFNTAQYVPVTLDEGFLADLTGLVVDIMSIFPIYPS